MDAVAGSDNLVHCTAAYASASTMREVFTLGFGSLECLLRNGECRRQGRGRLETDRRLLKQEEGR